MQFLALDFFTLVLEDPFCRGVCLAVQVPHWHVLEDSESQGVSEGPVGARAATDIAEAAISGSLWRNDESAGALAKDSSLDIPWLVVEDVDSTVKLVVQTACQE